ncbi:hypothetical protein [Nocardia sp. NPDC050435]|uniref:peptidase MA family metallohydrolase n=1 Tax=Nocardia sp. NPDC050435 TaxID=3155040 RepID=UPI0033E738C0
MSTADQALRRARRWCGARRRGQFALTVGLVTLLTGACGALLLAPNWALPTIRADQPSSPQRQANSDPRLQAVRGLMEPFGPITAVRAAVGDGPDALVVGHAAQRAELAVLAAELGPATASISELWGTQWARSGLVVVASNPSEFAALLRSPGLVPGEVAAAAVADPFAAGTQPTGQRVVFGPDAGRRLSPDGLRTILRHELTHVATRAATVDGAPQWLLEGFAEYAAHRGARHRFAEIAPTLSARLRAGASPAELPADPAFTGPDAAAVYEQAWSVCAFVAETYGEPRLVQLYRALAAGKQTPDTEDDILRTVLGAGRTEFTAAWRAWLGAESA